MVSGICSGSTTGPLSGQIVRNNNDDDRKAEMRWRNVERCKCEVKTYETRQKHHGDPNIQA